MEYPIIEVTPAKLLTVIEERSIRRIDKLIDFLESQEQESLFKVYNIFNVERLSDKQKLICCALSFDAYYGLPKMVMQQKQTGNLVFYIYEPIKDEYTGQSYDHRLWACAQLIQEYFLRNIENYDFDSAEYRLGRILESIDHRVTLETIYNWIDEDKRAFRFLEGAGQKSLEMLLHCLDHYPDVYDITMKILKLDTKAEFFKSVMQQVAGE